jgi:hypothetical protein
MSPLETLLAKLPGARKAGKGWSARCPAHDDRRASLSVSEGDDGTALVKCHAGCDTSAIIAAVGLTLADLFPPKPGPAPYRTGTPKAGGELSTLPRMPWRTWNGVSARGRRCGPTTTPTAKPSGW